MNIAGYSLIVTNENGESVDLYDDPDFGMTSSTGFGLDAEINTTSNHPMDGSTYNDTYIPERNLGFTLQYQESNSESAKLRVHRVFQPRQKLTIRYISPNVDAMIYGYCEKCDTPENAHPMATSISIICPDPFWTRGGSGQIVAELVNGECDIDYNGTVPTGFIIQLRITNPCVWIKVDCNGEIFDTDNSISGNPPIWVDSISEYQVGTMVEIDSITGEKAVLYYRSSDHGINRFTTTKVGQLYPELVPGHNHIKITSDGSFTGSVIYTEKIGGLL